MTKQRTNATRLLSLALACAALLPLLFCLHGCAEKDFNTPVKTVTTFSTYNTYPHLLLLNKAGRPLTRIYTDPLYYLETGQQPERWEYDENGTLLHYVNEWGNTYTYTYDKQGRPLRGVARDPFGQPTGQTHQYEYFENGYYRIDFLEKGLVFSQELYDERGRLLTYKQPSSPAYLYEYDEHGNVCAMSSEGEQPWRMTLSYDKRNRLTSWQATGDISCTFAYDRGSRLITRTYEHPRYSSPQKQETVLVVCAYTYDAKGNLTAYDGSRYVDGKEEPDANHHVLTYDEQGRLISRTIKSNAQTSTEMLYNENGLLRQETETILNRDGTLKSGSTVTYEYNEAGRLSKETSTSAKDLLNIQSYTYYLYEKHEQKRQYIQATYGMYSHQTEPVLREKSIYRYDTKGNLVSKYYEYGRVKADPQEEQYCYERNKRISYAFVQYAPDETKTLSFYLYEYDANGRLIKESYQDGDTFLPIYTYTYDEYGLSTCIL